MATRRMITSSIWRDDWFGQLSFFDQTLWIGLFSMCADDQGRALDNPVLIRADVFPYKDIPTEEIDQALDRFEQVGRIIRYAAGGKRLIQIVRWWEHQQPQWAQHSKYPAPDGWYDRIRTRIDSKYVEENWKDNPTDLEQVQVNYSGDNPSRDSQAGGQYPDHVPDPDQETPTEAQAPPPAKPQAKKSKAKPARASPPTPKQQESRAMFAAVAAACQINWRIGTEEQNNAVRQTEKKLREDANAKPTDVGEFVAFWNVHDWRGRQGDPPEPHQIREEWGRFEEWRKNGKPPYSKNGGGGKPDAAHRAVHGRGDAAETFFDPATERLVRKDPKTGELVPVP